MGNNSDPKFIFRLSRFPVYRGSVLGRFYCISVGILFSFYRKSDAYVLFHVFITHVFKKFKNCS